MWTCQQLIKTYSIELIAVATAYIGQLQMMGISCQRSAEIATTCPTFWNYAPTSFSKKGTNRHYFL